jgi:hypothetical protein
MVRRKLRFSGEGSRAGRSCFAIEQEKGFFSIVFYIFFSFFLHSTLLSLKYLHTNLLIVSQKNLPQRERLLAHPRVPPMYASQVIIQVYCPYATLGYERPCTPG